MFLLTSASENHVNNPFEKVRPRSPTVDFPWNAKN